ncbi:glycosyltransferase family 4 protein [Microbulbifer agarilyticus]|uniref:glycosyltransferase family 4 protein n=1 Tax=Microbulbifer agarilyticus TaxID=260552 RepID=UPI001C947493|nr:glycosyltransferase family 1 protein [Microbulbifer agarilyticus]MBY6189172.1 glycosyltransferase family 4 protein [Microbulbifer agarilyticus]
MAKIAVDARPLSAPTTGIGRYTYALLEKMFNSEHEWYLYSHQPLQVNVPEGENVKVRTGSVRKSALGSVFAQLKYPYWAKKDAVDLFWSPRHHLPVFLKGSCPTVVTVHDMVWRAYPETMAKAGLYLEQLLMPRALRQAEAVICVSESTRQDVQHYFPDTGHKLHVVPEAPFLPANGHISGLGEYFLFVGTLEPRKNLRNLLHAFRLYTRAVDSPLPLKICGGKGWGLPEIEGILAELDIEPYVEVLGYVSDRELKHLYREARALVMPSLYEGFGLPIVEAYSQGTPVITSDRGAMREIAGDLGVLVDPESPADIAGAFQTMTCQRELVARLKKDVITYVEKFDWRVAAQKTIDVMESAISSSDEK